MSVQAVTWVIEHSRMRLGARLVLLAIANHADRLGQDSSPSIGTIANEARLSLRDTRLAIRKAEALGELKPAPASRVGSKTFSLPKMASSRTAARTDE
jgi:hypothetical protein